MVEQYGSSGSDSSDDSPQGDLSGLDVVKEFDYSLVYSMDYHEPQDMVNLTLEFNKNPMNAAALSSGVGIEYELARFITVYPDIEKDLVEKLKDISAETKDTDPIKATLNALDTFVKLVGDVAGVLKIPGALLKNSLSAGISQIRKFSIREYASQESSSKDALAIKVSTDVDWPLKISQPEVLIEGYTRENNLYRKSDGNYLSASEGLKIPARRVVLPSLNILEVQDITSSARIDRNKFAVKLSIGTPAEKPGM